MRPCERAVGRIALLAGNDQLRLGTMLEAHPAVSRYCERPAWPDDETAGAASNRGDSLADQAADSVGCGVGVRLARAGPALANA